MRHLRSILYALVLAPAVWVLTGAGFAAHPATGGPDDFTVEAFSGLLLLLLAGTAYGILLLSPISPAGPVLAGLVFLALTVWTLLSPAGYAAIWPDFDLSRPGYGLAALLAVPLIGTALSGRRWAGYEPPVLPIIGRIGRPSGAAPVAGTPTGNADATVLLRTSTGFADDSEPTRVLWRPPAEAVIRGAETHGSDGVPVTSVPAVPTARPAVAVSSAADGEPTAPMLAEGAVAAESAEADAAPPERALPGPDASVDTPPAGVVPAASAEQADDEREGGAESAGKPSSAGERSSAGDREPADDVATVSADNTERADGIGAVDVFEPGERSGSSADVDGERTQVIRPMVAGAAGVAQPLRSPHPGRADPAVPAVAGSGERTRIIPSFAVVDVGGNETQVVSLPDTSVDGERTEVIRPGLVDPPGERTQVLRFPRLAAQHDKPVAGRNGPAAGPDGPAGHRDGPGEEPGPVGVAGESAGRSPTATSIANVEQPNLADDPTSPIVPFSSAPTGEEEPAAWRPALLDTERPPDEVGDDTVPVRLPTQRKPSPDDSTTA